MQLVFSFFQAAEKLASLATSITPTLPPATVEQLEMWKMLKEEENRVREEERRLLEEEVRIKEQELKKQHLLWQQQRISELQDTWTKHTTEEETKSESSPFEEDSLMLEYQSRNEDIAGKEQKMEEELKSAEKQREEDEEEEVRRLQSELHAQLLSQVYGQLIVCGEGFFAIPIPSEIDWLEILWRSNVKSMISTTHTQLPSKNDKGKNDKGKNLKHLH